MDPVKVRLLYDILVMVLSRCRSGQYDWNRETTEELRVMVEFWPNEASELLQYLREHGASKLAVYLRTVDDEDTPNPPQA